MFFTAQVINRPHDKGIHFYIFEHSTEQDVSLF